MNRPFGLGPIRTDRAFSDSRPLVVRQAAALSVGCFVDLLMVVMGIGVLLYPGTTVNSGNAFLDRWFFGILIVPFMWGTDRFLLRPRVRVDAEGVALHNPIRTIVAKWPAILGATFDTHLRLILADGETVRSVLFGPGLSSPLTKNNRVEELMEVINAESARRSGRTRDPEGLYAAEALVGEADSPVAALTGPGATLRQSPGLIQLAGYAAAWTAVCLVAAKLS